MTLDARAMVTLIQRGPGFELVIAALAKDENTRICATALAEAAILLKALGDPLAEMTVQILVDELELTVVPFTKGDWRTAVRQHELLKVEEKLPPRFGYCLSAAIAANTGAPIIDV